MSIAAVADYCDRLMGELSTLGLLCESLAMRDLVVYAQADNWELSHYGDSSGLEIDPVLTSLDYSSWVVA